MNSEVAANRRYLFEPVWLANYPGRSPDGWLEGVFIETAEAWQKVEEVLLTQFGRGEGAVGRNSAICSIKYFCASLTSKTAERAEVTRPAIGRSSCKLQSKTCILWPFFHATVLIVRLDKKSRYAANLHPLWSFEFSREDNLLVEGTGYVHYRYVEVLLLLLCLALA